MAKRFTDTEKWSRPWVRNLPPKYKLFWVYILDNCDKIGIWYADFGLASYLIGDMIDEKEALILFDKQITQIGKGERWFIRDFVSFQYGKIRKDCAVHKAVLKELQAFGLSWPENTLLTPCRQGGDTLKDKDKDKAKEKAKAKATVKEKVKAKVAVNSTSISLASSLAGGGVVQ